MHNNLKYKKYWQKLNVLKQGGALNVYANVCGLRSKHVYLFNIYTPKYYYNNK